MDKKFNISNKQTKIFSFFLPVREEKKTSQTTSTRSNREKKMNSNPRTEIKIQFCLHAGIPGFC
jgi:hypothetical protein